jgi:exopolysaccharide biosynthesis polyprenyl glycosylphosphotransferase
MKGKSAILDSEEKKAWTPPVPAAKKFRWQPSREFLTVMTMVGDALVIFAGSSLGFWVRFDSGWIPLAKSVKSTPDFIAYVNLIMMGTGCLLVTFGYMHLYGRTCFMRYFQKARIIVKGSVFWLFAFLGVSLILKFEPPISRMFMLSSFVCVLGGMLAWRFILVKIKTNGFFEIQWRQRVIFVGWSLEAGRIFEEIRGDHHHPYEVIGCVPSPLGQWNLRPLKEIPVLGDYQNLPALLKQQNTHVVILADPFLNMGEVVGLANLCELEFVEFKVIPTYFKILATGLRLEMISGIPILGITELPLSSLRNRLIKRGMDIVGALVGLVLAAPLLAVFGALVRYESPGPMLFKQERMGKNGRPFLLFKIRSMRLAAEEHGAQWAVENDPRRLKVGTFIRRWNIDEVPQFWNVLKGEMSLVGPRPERPELIEQFKHEVPHYHARHSCLPGMTGWAQVNGWRGNTSLAERIRYDIWYVENWRLELDFRIMIMTFLRQKNAY